MNYEERRAQNLGETIDEYFNTDDSIEPSEALAIFRRDFEKSLDTLIKYHSKILRQAQEAKSLLHSLEPDEHTRIIAKEVLKAFSDRLELTGPFEEWQGVCIAAALKPLLTRNLDSSGIRKVATCLEEVDCE